MGNVAATLKVMPEGPETDIEKMREEIMKIEPTPKDVQVEEIAFGLKAVKVLFVIPDAQGGTDELEEKLSKISGVKDVSTEEVSLI